MSGLRMIHICNGHDTSILKTPFIKQVLDGRKNLDAVWSRPGNSLKRAVTPSIMKLIKISVKTYNLAPQDRLLIWSVCTLAFFGLFRIHELLAKNSSYFDPDFELLKKDVILRDIEINKEKIKIIQVLIKSEKSDRVGAGTIVDVYANDGPLCPVKAFTTWQSFSPAFPSKEPCFRFSSGIPLTGKKFNAILHDLLKDHLNYEQGKITAHSFRRGLPTMMANLGFASHDIMALGRWSSEAYKNYIKLPRTKRLEMANSIRNLTF